MPAFSFSVPRKINASDLRVGGDATWLDFNFDGATLANGAAAPDVINWNSTNIRVSAFDGVNTAEALSKVIELNHNWKQGTTIKPHVHWCPTTADSGNVEWILDWFAIESGVYTGVDTISVVQAAGGVAWGYRFATLPDITTLTDYLIGTQMGFCLRRDPTAGNPDDTYEHDAALLTVGLHVQIDTLGSRQVAVK